MSPAKGMQTRSNGQPAPREFGIGPGKPPAVPHPGSWWLVPPQEFSAAWKAQQDRLTKSSTSYSQQAQTEPE